MLLNNWFKAFVSFTMAIVVCGILLVSNTYLALAATDATIENSPNVMKDRANDLINYQPDITDADPVGIEEISEEAKKGLNAVQAGAGEDNIIDSQDTDPSDRAANFLDNLFN